MKLALNQPSSTVFLATTLLLGLTACHPPGESPDAAREIVDQALEPREVTLVTAEPREERPKLELVGEVRPYETVRISNEVSGRIDRVLVEVGDRIGEDDVIVEIDRETHRLQVQQAEANLAAAKANLVLAEKDLERKKDLLTDKTIAQAIFDQTLARRDLAEAQVMAAEATRDLAKRDLDRSAVRSLSAGSVAKRMVSAGQWIDVGTGLIDLAISDRLKVAARVPETWATRLSGLEEFEFSVGQNGELKVAKLYSVEPVVQGASRSFEIVGTAPADGSTLRPGMFATVVLRAPNSQQSLWLPASAIATSDTPVVFVVEDDVIRDHRVTIGRRVDGFIEVLSGIDTDLEVVSVASGLNRGLPAKVIQ
ncbi:MAG: efflux RND transporter periplasmic adaptor subunit [bacterium]|nr:efflux RND transporter periplasmic adaptor subunit [bacterium]